MQLLRALPWSVGNHAQAGNGGVRLGLRLFLVRTCDPNTRSLPVDLNVLFAAAMGDGDHDPDADQNRESDQCPDCANPLQHTQFPKGGHDSADHHDETN